MAFKKNYNNNIEMICMDDFKCHCYLIFMDIIVDYKV